MESRSECFPALWPGADGSAKRNRHALDDQAELVRRAKASDQTAFREILERYQARVFSIIHRIVRDRNDVEDIAQEVFASAFLSIKNYRSEGSLAGWLCRIAVNESYEHLRRKKSRPLAYEADLPETERRTFEVPGAALPIDTVLAQRDLALKLLAHVSEEERYLLLLREVEGHSIAEIAELTGINPNNVKVRLFRARAKLLGVARRRNLTRQRAQPVANHLTGFLQLGPQLPPDSGR